LRFYRFVSIVVLYFIDILRLDTQRIRTSNRLREYLFWYSVALILSTMSDSDVTAQNLSYDPMFDSTDADFVLCSLDGIYYRIHSFILRITSSFFRAMLTLPQQRSDPGETATVTLGETSKVLGVLLRMISGLEIPKWESLDDVEAVLDAAHKYDMPGPIATLRVIASSHLFLAEPLATVKVDDSATIRSDDSTGDSSGESGSDPESTESTPESIRVILDRRSSCSIYVIT
jgi:hypothetical protein